MFSNEYDGTKNGLLFWKTVQLPLPYKPTFLTTSCALRRVSGPPIVSNNSLPLRKPKLVQPAVHVVDRGSDVWS